jgi:hypothetical protein
MAKKPITSKSLQFRQKYVGYTEDQLRQMTKKALNQARVRVQRLSKATNRLNPSKLSTATQFALEPLKPFLNKSGNVSLSVKGMSKDTLIHALEVAMNFNKVSYTTVKGNREQYAKEAKSSGRTIEEQEQYKRYWKIADDYGLLDWYEPSEEEHSEDVYKFVTDAEEAEMTDEQFIDFVRRKVLERANGIYNKLKEEDERNSGDLYDEQFAKILGKILGNPMS